MQRLLKRFANFKFKTKILCIVGLVASIPSFLLFFFFYRQNQVLFDREIENINLSFKQQENYINQRMTHAKSTALKICSNSEISQFFRLQNDNSDYVLEYIKVVRPLLTYIQATEESEVSAIRFYTLNQNLFSNLTIYSKSPEFFDEIASLLEDSGTIVQHSSETGSRIPTKYYSEGTLSIYSSILTPSSSKTFLEYELSFENIIDTLEIATNNFENTDYTLFHESGSILFSSDPEFAKKAPTTVPYALSGQSLKNLKLKSNGKNLLINACPISSIDCVLISHSDLSRILLPVRQNQMLYLLILFACVALSCFLTIILVNRLLHRTNAINDAICQIRQGDFDIALPVQGADFIDQIADNLNSMASQISNLIRNNYEKQLQIKNLQIRMLSQQISPHFLYNTLECLKMQAVLNDENDTAQALTSLGHLLRYYANNASSLSTVGRELEAAQDYVNIMNLIEGRKCILNMNISEDCLPFIMPPFILQPIVENSIKHGVLSSSCEVHVQLSIERSGDLMHIEIADNGVGISPETLSQIQARLKDGQVSYQYGNQQTSIGLYNTNARIKLFYGDSYGLSLSSVEKEGTCVRLTIPVSCPDTGFISEGGKEDLYV